MLDECRSIPPSGSVIIISNNMKFVELYISEADTSELNHIDMIPIFNTFDIWMAYDK